MQLTVVAGGKEQLYLSHNRIVYQLIKILHGFHPCVMFISLYAQTIAFGFVHYTN